MEIKEGGFVVIKGDNIENGGLKIVKNYGSGAEGAKAEKPLTDEELKEKIERVKKHLTNKRLWFSVCKYIMQRHMVGDGDFVSAADKIEELYPGTNLDPDDLSRMNVMSFRKSHDNWDINNAPVKNTTFSKYLVIAELMEV